VMANRCGCRGATCAEQGATCGAILDGFGATVQCGTCPAGQTCGAVGPNGCGVGTCQPRTCQALDAECGMVSDGCSRVLTCGTCGAGEICGSANQCGN
jgi:hypothetical protein